MNTNKRYKDYTAVAYFIRNDIKKDLDDTYNKYFSGLKKNEFINIITKKGLEVIKEGVKNGTDNN